MPGIPDTIASIRSVDNERPILTAFPKLVAIDAPDGAGKTTICRYVSEILQKKLGQTMLWCWE